MLQLNKTTQLPRSVRGAAASPMVRAAAARPPLGAQQQRHFSLSSSSSSSNVIACRATNKDDDAIERMKADAARPDVFSSELVATALKVALVALVGTVATLLFDAAHPIVDATVERFPSLPQQ